MSPFNPFRSLEVERARKDADDDSLLSDIRADLRAAGIGLDAKRFTNAPALRTGRKTIPVYPVEVRFDPSIIRKP